METLERGAGFGGLFTGMGAVGGDCWEPCGSKMLRLLATDSECCAVALGGLVAGAGVLCGTARDTAVGGGGSFLPAGALGLCSGYG